jgi:chromate transporter
MARSPGGVAGSAAPADPVERTGLAELAAIFLRIGLTAFGGPAGHIAMMRDEFVRRRGWLDDADFIDLLGAANLIPGPTSTELAMHLGHRRAGRAGLVVAGLAFLLPAVLIVAGLAWIYVEHGRRPELGALLAGISPIVVAIVAHAGWAIAGAALRGPLQAALVFAAIAAVLAGVAEIAVLLGAGALSIGWIALHDRNPAIALVGWAWPSLTGTAAGSGSSAAAGAGSSAAAGSVATAAVGAVATAVAAASLATPGLVLVTFLKIGAVLFGSGYVLVALLRSELVDGLGWITETQLIDAVAVGQATPGPLFSTATFIGYLVGGPLGALAATVGVFLPAFVAVLLSVPILDRLRGSVPARAFLDGVNAAAVGLLAVVAVQLAFAAVRDVVGVATMIGAFVLLIRGVGTGRLIAAGAVIALVRWLLGSG